jgi:ubiquinone/menaquinone biosynthesis C-methylase UbiE
MHEKTFSQYEREGWERNAADYDTIDLPATRQAIRPLLDSVAELHGRRVLELASGTGHLAEHAVARGATVVGVDVATNMVVLASQRVPGATFQEGDAEALPFEDAHFDVVLCCFGLLHFAQPAQALREAARVLKPGAPVPSPSGTGRSRVAHSFGLSLGPTRPTPIWRSGYLRLPPCLRWPILPYVTRCWGRQALGTSRPGIWPLCGPSAGRRQYANSS